MEADPRHVELIVRELELEIAKISNTPGSKAVNGSAKVEGEDTMKPEEEKEDEETEELGPSEATQFRAVVVRMNYITPDRPDIQSSMDLNLRRTKVASRDLFKRACKIPKAAKVNTDYLHFPEYRAFNT